MNGISIPVRELAAWGFDEYEYRPTEVKPLQASPHRPTFTPADVLLAAETERLRDVLAREAARPDLRDEMNVLRWSLGVVDLRQLIAFQRRLFFDPDVPRPAPPAQDDWPGLVKYAFGAAKCVQCTVAHDGWSRTLVLRAANPDVHLRVTGAAEAPLSLFGGGPFLEVARLRGRWFLRDGYHRTHALLRAGIFAAPAVMIETQTMEELRALGPWFFPESVLFSPTPPLITDFLEDDVTVEYRRPRLIKTIRITYEETLTPGDRP